MDSRKICFSEATAVLFNIHTHTEHSHDSQAKIDDLCEQALKEGLSGFAVTDHCDCAWYYKPEAYTSLLDSWDDCQRAKTLYNDRLILACGVEIGEAISYPDFAHKVKDARPWDVVLGSVHAVRVKGWDAPFSILDFSGCGDAFIRDYLRQYFDDLYEMAATEDYDVLCHLTVPLRYICGKYGKRVELEAYYPRIEEILRVAVERDKTFEINTSGCTPGKPRFIPDEAILDKYLSMGGRNLTVGSDAHAAERLTNGLDMAAEMLRRKGVRKLTYYLNRKPIQYAF